MRHPETLAAFVCLWSMSLGIPKVQELISAFFNGKHLCKARQCQLASFE